MANDWGDEAANDWGDRPARLDNAAPVVDTPSGTTPVLTATPRKAGIIDKAIGGAETLAAIGSRAIAYPFGLAAAAGKFASPSIWFGQERPVGIPMPDATDENGNPIPFDSLPKEFQDRIRANNENANWREKGRRAFERAGEQRNAVESALSYEPRTSEGQRILHGTEGVIGTVTKPIAWVGDRAGDAAAAYAASQGAQDPEQEQIRRVVSEGATVGAGTVAGDLIRTGVPAVRQAVPQAVKDYAERAAVRSLNADRAATKRVLGRPLDKAARNELGRYLLDNDIPLRSPGAAQDALGDALKTEGPEIGAALNDATRQGARVNLNSVYSETMKAIDDLKLDAEHRPIYNRVKAYLDDQVSRWGPDMTPVQAHKLRKLLDDLSQWDKNSNTVDKKVAGAFREARIALDNEMGDTMQRAGLGEQWETANANYKNASRGKDLADVGTERRESNRVASPSEKAAAIVGGAAGLAAHDPMLALGIPAATWAFNRGFFPVTARVADVVSKLTKPGPLEGLASGSTGALSEASGYLENLRNRIASNPGSLPGLGVAGAAAQEPAGTSASTRGQQSEGEVTYGTRTASIPQRFTDVVRSNPAALGPHGATLSRILEKNGPQGLAAAHYVLSMSDPKYRAAYAAALNPDPSQGPTIAQADEQ